MSRASQACVPTIPAKSLRPFWTEELDDLKAKSVFWHRIWQDSGRPSNGALHQIKISTQLKYKLAIRQSFVDFENRHTDELHMHFLNKNVPEFWKVWNRNFNKSVISHVTINGSVNDQQVADAFAVHFSDICASAPLDEIESRNFACDNACEVVNTFNYEIIDKCIRILKCGKASGPDGLTVLHLWSGCFHRAD